MADSAVYDKEQFANAEQQMSALVAQSLKKYNMPVNAVFTRMSDIAKGMSKNIVKWGHKLALASAVRPCMLRT